MRPMPEARPRSLSMRVRSPYAAALLIVVACTAVAEFLYRVLHTNRLSTVFLAAVLITAVRFGSGPAYFAAVIAFGIYNFYLVEPRFTLNLGSAEDVLLLVLFLAVAMLTGRLAGRVRDQAATAQSRARTAGALFEASRNFSGLNDEEAIRTELLKQVSQAAGGPALMSTQGRISTWPDGVVVPDMVAGALDEPRATVAPGWRMRPLATQEDLGRVAWREPASGTPTDEDPLIDVLVDVGASAIIRARLAAAEAEVRAIAQTERLRNALLSSISHDLRTPLASILASASSLREFGDQFEPAVKEDLLSTIQEEAERLNQFVANLLQMTKLEGGALGVQCSRVNVREVSERVLKRLQRRAGRRQLRVAPECHGLEVRADPNLLEQAIANVVENAIRFSPDGSQVLLTGARLDAFTLVEVSDEGPGVPQEDLCRIFDKFYRSPASAAQVAGAGLGLSIVRGLVEAMDGSVTARESAPGAGGLTVSLLLPSAAAA